MNLNNILKVSFGASFGYVFFKSFFKTSFKSSCIAGLISSIAFRYFLYKPSLTYKSQLDPNKIVDRDNWAVTLINSDVAKTSKLYGHAQIAIEGGLSFDRRVTYIAHIFKHEGTSHKTFLGRVKLNKVKGAIEFVDKTETLIRTSNKVNSILKSINSEIRDQKRGKYIDFNLLSKRKKIYYKMIIKENSRLMKLTKEQSEVFGDTEEILDRIASDKRLQDLLKDDITYEKREIIESHNCITWALDKLEMADIKLDSSLMSNLFLTPKQFTSKGICAVQ